MKKTIFIGRKKELNFLNREYNQKTSKFIVLWGRRRVGKSKLIKKFMEDKNGIYLLGRQESEFIQLKRFSSYLANFFDDDVLKKQPFNNWDAFFTYLFKKAEKEQIILALDEFPYLIDATPSLCSILQDHWDKNFERSSLYLILLGSSVSMMESKVLGNKSPLYGRRDGQILLKPFTIGEVSQYLGDLNSSEIIKFYSVYGGTPAYILEINKKQDVFTNIENTILDQNKFLYKDIPFILREEISEPRYYFSILESIAKGKTKISEIVNDTGLNKSIVSKYISILIDLHIVKRKIPITESKKSRKGRYYISDNFILFWFLYVYPYEEYIERGKQKVVIDEIFSNFSSYVGHIFENVVEDLLWNISLGFIPTKIGSWWYKDKEIDLLALDKNKKNILFCGCKWSEDVDAKKIYNQLKEKSRYVNWYTEDREEYYAIFAKSYKEKIEIENLLLFDLDDIRKNLD